MTWAASGAIAMYYYAAQLSKPIFICPPHVTRVVCYSIAIVLPLSFPLTFVAAWASPEIEQTAPWLKVGFLYVGRSVIWILRMIFNVPGMNPKDAGLFTATTLPGFFFIPFWWCASARYFKSEMPGGIAWAGASIAMVLVTCFAVATLI